MTFYESDAKEVIDRFTRMYLKEFTNLLPTLITWECENKDDNYRLSSGQLERILRLGTGLAVLGRNTANEFTILSDNMKKPFYNVDPMYTFREKNFTVPGEENPGAPLIVVTNQLPQFTIDRRISPSRGLLTAQSTDLDSIQIASEEMATLRWLRYANAVQLNQQAFISGQTVQSVKEAEERIASLSPFVGIVPWEQEDSQNFVKNTIQSQSIATMNNMSSFSSEMDTIFKDLMIRLGVPAMESKEERRVVAEVEALKSVPQIYASSYQNVREEVCRLIKESHGYDLHPVYTMSWQAPAMSSLPQDGNINGQNLASLIQFISSKGGQ